MSIKSIIIGVTVLCFPVLAQYDFYYVTSVNAVDATAFSNSHKIAVRGDWVGDTIHIVFHDDSVYYTFSTDGGPTWSTPVALAPGTNPALDIDHMAFRHVAWQQFDPADSTYDVYYDCLDDWALPVNISESSNNSTFPDVVADASLTAHVVWQEERGPNNYIYYRPCVGAMPGDTVRISDFGSSVATYSYPSVSIYCPNDRIYAVWDCYDTGSYSPYQIHVRYKEGANWSDVETYAHYLALRHSSVDFGHGEDALSLCYEDSSSGNLEATFVGGNGGGYPTQGRSKYPVVATVGSTWSYLYWQEDSAGFEDICCHFYYFVTGWTPPASVRSIFSIDKPVRYPNCCGANLVWTQGDTAPYSIYYGDFGYPIGVEEARRAEHMPSLVISPNPFREMTNIRLEALADDAEIISIYSTAGHLVKILYPQSQISNLQSVVWDGTDNAGEKVPAGTYFCILETSEQRVVKKVVRLR